jgi:hypothetical protein
MVKETKTVSKVEFDKLSDSVEKLAGLVSGLVDKISTPKVEEKPVVEVKDDAKPEAVPVPPAWRKIVDDTLGADFGVDVVYPESGAGFKFRIIVPLKKSNASQAHLEFYKVDVRTKAISYSEGIEGVRAFCELVAKNLGIIKQNRQYGE